MKHLTYLILLISLSLGGNSLGGNPLFAQKKKNVVYPSKPKLIVGIVIDQMRYDFLYRYAEKYGKGGIKRLMNEGFNCKNNHYNYLPTNTAPGHTAIFTGSVPAIHGIVGNEWYDRKLGKPINCVDDSTVATVGSLSKAGKMSPQNLLTTTITDQLRLSNNFQSKVIGIALKDRGAILPGGHTANAAYWVDGSSGNWISSTFYMKDLPQWVKDFNAKKITNKYLAKPWTTLLPIDQYTESTADNMPYEEKIAGENAPVFPHNVADTTKSFYEISRKTPFGNTITKDFAIATLNNEQLGKGKVTDFLTVSFSSTDYVGHSFGPNSIEVEDTYLRLDKDIEELLTFLDKYLGKENVLVFLSADHGVSNVWKFNVDNKIPSGTTSPIMADLGKELEKTYGVNGWILSSNNYQIFLNYALMQDKSVSFEQIYTKIREHLLKQVGIANVLNLHDLSNISLNSYQAEFVKNGYNQKRGGDIMYLPEPAWLDGYVKTGTGHGTMYNYDTHVPLLWYGWKIPQGETVERTNITDISATLAALLNILEPNGCIGKPIKDVFVK
jgi:predicted AlkP superfamily pyrophosphatase or phosphodiesterase